MEFAGLGVDIADTSDGLDAFRPVSVEPQLLPQITHMHVDAAVEGAEGSTQDCLHEFLPLDDGSGPAKQTLEQIELNGSELELLSAP